MNEFKRTFTVRWADLDPNRHMRHSAYNDYAAQLRLEFFDYCGLSLKRLNDLHIGPILFREETRFSKEVLMNEHIVVDFAVQKSRKNASKWTILHQIFKEHSGELAARITVDGAWLDLVKRRTTVPEKEVIEILLNAPKTSDFEWLPDKKGQ